MGKNKSASGLTNIISYDNSGNISFVSGSTTLMSVSSSGAVTLTNTMSGGVAVSASLSANSNLLEGTGSVGFSTTASLLAVSSSQQQISSSLLTLTASYTALSSSYIALSASYNTFSGSASTRVTQIESVYATTGSNSFRANQSITGSLVVSSTITAQTLVVQTVTSSIVYSSGSNLFGSALGDRQTFTGSLFITGSQTVFGNVGIGTTSTTHRLNISTPSSSASGIQITKAGVLTSFLGDGGSEYPIGVLNLYDSGSQKVQIYAGSVSYFTGGNVGIGTTNPAYTLDVSGTGKFNSNLIVNNSGTYSTNGYALNIESNSWAIVDANVKRQMQRVVGYVGDYEQHVILLHPIYNNTLIEYNKCSGTLYATRGATYAGRISDTYEIDTSTAYNSFTGTLKSNVALGKLYTCLYGGIKYMAIIPEYRTSAVQYHFDGYISSNSGGETLKLITYRISNTGVIINSEINNSLTAYTENDTFTNGLFYPRQGIRFASGATTLNYYEEGTFTPTNVGSNMAAVTVGFGKYVRIGNQVTVNARWIVSPGGTGQKYFVFHLPFAFAISSSIGYTGAVSNYNNGLSAYSSNVGTTVRNSSGSDTQQYVEAVFTTNAETTMHLSMTYFTF
jgi:hypothetical protein